MTNPGLSGIRVSTRSYTTPRDTISGIPRNCELLANVCLCVPVRFFCCGVDVALM